MPGHIGNPMLYFLLFFGEIYHIFMALIFWFTIWRVKNTPKLTSISSYNYSPSVDVFIPVAGEPVEIVRRSAVAAKNMEYPNHRVFLLNDGFVAKKDNWRQIEVLAEELRIRCITREKAGGAKAGNINNALLNTSGEIIVIFDADMVPYSNFLKKVIPFFKNEDIGFVQTPQYYVNSDVNEVTRGAWEQQEFFFGPIMKGKEKNNASFICGTNFAIRRIALLDVGGMCENNIAEDFLTSLSIHQKGWLSYYLNEVLSEGLAPEDLLSYYKQQLRWARGSLEVLFSSNPLFKKGLSFGQKIQYISSALFYFNGFITLIDIAIPIIFLSLGIEAVSATTTSFAIFFIPFMFFSLYTLYLVSNKTITFRAISFTQSSWTLQLLALKSVLLRQKIPFSVTSKKALEGNFIYLVYPHLFYILLFLISSVIAIKREGINPSVITNMAWGMFNISMFIPFIFASFRWDTLFSVFTKPFNLLFSETKNRTI